MAELIGQVAALPQASLRALTGVGLAGEPHADPLSPRQVLLASSSTYADFALPVQALHENLLIDADTSRLVSGAVLRIGAHALLRLMFQCEACGKLDPVQPGLARRLGARRGILARVIQGGAIHTGDPVRDLGPLLPAWADDWRARVLHVLSAMPDGVVVEYGRLARLAGVDPGYCRAFPRLLAQRGIAAKAIPAKSATAAPRWNGDGLFDDEAGLHLPL